MTKDFVSVGPAHSLRTVAQRMAARNVGAAVVLDSDLHGICMITERDVSRSLGRGEDPDRELVGSHLTSDVLFVGPDVPLDKAAIKMVKGGRRHLVVVDGGDVVGVISVRDIVRGYVEQGSAAGELLTAPVPAAAAEVLAAAPRGAGR